MFGKVAHRRVAMAAFLAVTSLISHLFAEEGEYSAVFKMDSTVVVLRNGAEYLTVDLKGYYTPPKELMLSIYKAGLSPISPDRRYIPAIIDKGSGGAAILLIDLKENKVTRQEISDNPNFRFEKAEWVTPTKLGIFDPPAVARSLWFDAADGSHNLLCEESDVTWDSAGRNYASIFGKSDWYGGRLGASDFPDSLLGLSQALRYNSFWVYPEPLNGFVTEEEYRTWRKDIGVREHPKGGEKPPVVQTQGVVCGENHQLSAPVFVEDTSWLGFFEQVFPRGGYDTILETNAVLLNAHLVRENPPNPANIQTKKKRIGFNIVPDSKTKYIDLSCNLRAKWNPQTKCLELWKYLGLKHPQPDPPTKLGEIPVDLQSMALGQFRPAADPSSIKWSWFADRKE